MIEQISTIKNKKIAVTFMLPQDAVFIENIATKQTKVFGGWSGLKEQFNSFCESFSNEINFEYACDYFKPNILPYIVNA